MTQNTADNRRPVTLPKWAYADLLKARVEVLRKALLTGDSKHYPALMQMIADRAERSLAGERLPPLLQHG